MLGSYSEGRQKRFRRSYTSGSLSRLSKTLRTQLQEMRERSEKEALLLIVIPNASFFYFGRFSQL